MVDVIEKRADPQKKDRLLASKKAWKESVSLLIAKLIAFKRGLNGRGDEDANLPRVDLKDPFPVEFNTYLSSIVDDYSKVVKGADFIINLQGDFSRTRRRGRREMREQGLSRAASGPDPSPLTAEASWWGSRAWARLALYGLDKNTRQTRVKMLKFVADRLNDLREIEHLLVSKDDAKAISNMLNFANHFSGTLLFRLKQLEDAPISPASPVGPPGAPKLPAVSDNVEPVINPENIKPGPSIVGGKPPVPLDISAIKEDVHGPMATMLAKARNADILSADKISIETNYTKLIKALSEESPNTNVIVNLYNVLKGLFVKHNEKISQAYTETEELRKAAHNAVTRWLRRKRMGLFPSKADEMRDIIVDDIHDLYRHLNTLMNNIENIKSTTADVAESVWNSAAITQAILGRMGNLAFDYDASLSDQSKKDRKSRPLGRGVIVSINRAKKSLDNPAKRQAR